MAARNLASVRKTVTGTYRSTKYVTTRSHSVWTEDKIIKSPYKDVDIPKVTLYDYVWENLDRWPERTASICAVTGRGYTFEQAFKLSNNFAANLRHKFNIRDGDVIAVMLPNIPDYPLIAMGILEAGGVITTLNPVYLAHNIKDQLIMSDSKVIVTLPELANIVKHSLKLAQINIPIIVVKANGEDIPDDTVLFSELSEDVNVDKSCLKEVRRSAKDLCLLPFSSGTTGMPKGVELTNRNIIANCQQINDESIATHNETTDTHQDSALVVLPLFHIYGATMLMFHKMAHGIKLVTLPRLQPDYFINALVKYKTNLLYVAPPIVLLMLQHPGVTSETLQHVDCVINGAAALLKSDAYKLYEKAKKKLSYRQGYGLTETSPVITLAARGTEEYGSVGCPIPNTQIKLVNADMANVGPNQNGEILVKGPQVMRGYRNNPAANDETFTPDGWLRTGDVAKVDEKGVVTIVDRMKELIKVKGFQVPPVELESILKDHPEVAEAAVVGVPHATSGEAPRAFIVVKKGSEVDSKTLKEFVADRVPSYKRLEDVIFLDSIPKSATGKVLKKEIKEKYC